MLQGSSEYEHEGEKPVPRSFAFFDSQSRQRPGPSSTSYRDASTGGKMSRLRAGELPTAEVADLSHISVSYDGCIVIYSVGTFLPTIGTTV